jgi:hypothetical protein
VGSTDMVYKTGFRHEVISTSIFCVKASNIRIIAQVEGTTYVSFSHVSGADMNLEISGLGEFFVATKVLARYLLPFLQRLPRMLTINVVLKLSLTRALQVAEQTIGMLFSDVGLELRVCGETEMDWRSIWSKRSWNYTLGAEELCSSVDTLFVLAETY